VRGTTAGDVSGTYSDNRGSVIDSLNLMKGLSMRGSILAVVCLTLLMAVPFSAQAQDKQTIHFKITKDGLVTSDITMDGKRFTVPQGVRLKLVFEYADANGNSHQFTVHSAKTELTGKQLLPDGPKTSTMELTVGERGEDFYRISCDLPCVAMEELTDYILFVGRSMQS
jgi:hypothetical protein